MGQLVLFLTYLAIIGAVGWNFLRLLREPAARTVTRVLFVAIVGFVVTAMLYIGITR